MKKRFYYLRDEINRPVVTVCLIGHESKIYRGVAICSDSDNPCKKTGCEIAEERARKAMHSGRNLLESNLNFYLISGFQYKSSIVRIMNELEQKLMNRKGMTSFGQALKNARKTKKKTLRELGKAIGKSIGYISDIEHDRRRPPSLDTVAEIEECLGIDNGYLLNLAKKIRKKIRPTIAQRLKTNPKLSHVLLRADELPERVKDKAMDKILETIKQFEEEEKN